MRRRASPPSRGNGPIRAGVRRLFTLLLVVTAATAVLALLLGLAFGADPVRAVATGFSLVGCFALMAAVALGARGPVRPTATADGEPASSFLGLGIGARGVRPVTADERREASSLAWLFLVVGAVLIVLGVLADGGVDLL